MNGRTRIGILVAVGLAISGLVIFGIARIYDEEGMTQRGARTAGDGQAPPADGWVAGFFVRGAGAKKKPRPECAGGAALP